MGICRIGNLAVSCWQRHIDGIGWWWQWCCVSVYGAGSHDNHYENASVSSDDCRLCACWVHARPRTPADLGLSPPVLKAAITAINCYHSRLKVWVCFTLGSAVRGCSPCRKLYYCSGCHDKHHCCPWDWLLGSVTLQAEPIVTHCDGCCCSWASVHPGGTDHWFQSCRRSDYQPHVQGVWISKTSRRLVERRWAADWRPLPCDGKWKPGDCRELFAAQSKAPMLVDVLIFCSYSALTLLVGWQKGHPACKTCSKI